MPQPPLSLRPLYLALLAAITTWLADSAIASWLQGIPFSTALLPTGHLLWLRLLLVALLLVVGIALTMGRHRRDALACQLHQLSAILESAGDAIITIDTHGIIHTFNGGAERLFGWPAREVVGWSINRLMPTTQAEQHNSYISEYLRTGRAYFIGSGPREVTACRRDGTPFEIDLAISRVNLGSEVRFIGIARDITDRKQAERELRHNEALLARAQQIARLGSWEWNIESGQLHWSEQIYRIFGVEPNAFQPTYEAFMAQVHPEDRERVANAVSAALAGDQAYCVEHRICLPDGSERVVQEQGEITLNEAGQPLQMTGTVQDVTERAQALQALEFISNFDPLTELPNRSLLQYRLKQALSRAHREGHSVALLVFGLDRFQKVNDTLGHTGGDELLKVMARRLEGALREGDIIARVGADEFGVVMDGLSEVDQVTQFGQELQGQLRDATTIAGHEVFITACLGIALYPHDGQDVSALLKHADAALHRAKSEGPDSFRFFTEDMTAGALQRLALEKDLRRALERAEFELFYQPQITLDNDEVIGVEALLRWRHPERGLIRPDHFIPILEDTGLILPVGRWVLQQACQQIRSWQANGLPCLRIAVNLSALQFRDPTLLAAVASTLEGTGLHAVCLELEITESLLVENVQQAISTLQQLNRMGVQVSIDDFGTGYSSMSYLQRLPVHTLKLDRSFVTDITDNSDSLAIAQAVIALAHSLRLKVIAEGVETAEQLETLRHEHCDEVQGYYFAAPMPAAEMELWLAGRAMARCAAATLPPISPTHT